MLITKTLSVETEKTEKDIEVSLGKWRYESHMWRTVKTSLSTQNSECIWCGTQLFEYIDYLKIKLCPNNPDLKKYIEELCKGDTWNLKLKEGDNK